MRPSPDSDRVDQTASRQQERAASSASFANAAGDRDQATHLSPEDFVVKTFSAGTAAVQLSGKGAVEAAEERNGPLSEEDKEAARRQIDCRRRLIIMKAHNADDGSPKSIIPQEDLQEWLDNLQLRLHQACLTPSPQVTVQSGRPRTQRPARLSVTFAPGPALSVAAPRSATSSPESSSRGVRRLKVNQLSGGIMASAANSASGVHPLITRPRSISVLTDQAAAALTDGNYIEQLQVSLQQASVSSLRDRLQERKSSTVHPTLVDQLTNQKGASASVRAKTPTHTSPSKSKGRKKSSSSQLPLLPDKLTPTGSAGHLTVKRDKSKKCDRPKTSADETESMLSLSSSASSRSLDQLLARQQARQQQEKANEDKDSQRSPVSDKSNNDRPLTHSSPLPGRSRQFAPRNFFDSGQTVDDIYIAAEHLLLPPARREAANSSEPTPTLQTETIIQIQRGSPDEEIQVEDFWGAMPDY